MAKIGPLDHRCAAAECNGNFVVYGVGVTYAYGWIAAAKDMDKWCIGVENGEQDFEDAWRSADKRESGRRHKRGAASSRAANERILPDHVVC